MIKIEKDPKHPNIISHYESDYGIDITVFKNGKLFREEKNKKMKGSFYPSREMPVEIPMKEEKVEVWSANLVRYYRYPTGKKIIRVPFGKNVYYEKSDIIYKTPMHDVKAEKKEAFKRLAELKKKPYRILDEWVREKRIRDEIIMNLPDKMPDDEYKKYTKDIPEKFSDEIHTGKRKLKNIAEYIQTRAGVSEELIEVG